MCERSVAFDGELRKAALEGGAGMTCVVYSLRLSTSEDNAEPRFQIQGFGPVGFFLVKTKTVFLVQTNVLSRPVWSFIFIALGLESITCDPDFNKKHLD